MACDPDSVAIRIAQTNAAINGCGSRVSFVTGQVEEVGQAKFDLLVANLTLEIIEESLDQMASHLRPEGALVLSGILSHQLSRLQTRRRKTSLAVQDRTRKGEWICLVLKRKA